MSGKRPLRPHNVAEPIARVTAELLDAARVKVDPGRPPPDEAIVASLMESISKVGLLNPITVWRPDPMMLPHLIAGRNRLEAVRRLGHETVWCIVLPEYSPTSRVDAALAEIVENLHRRELGAEERAALIRAYAERLRERNEFQSRQPVAVESKRSDRRGHRAAGVASKVAKDLGVTKRTVQRALAGKKPEPAVKAEPATAPPAPKPPASTEPKDLVALCRAWDRASTESRQRFLENIKLGRGHK